MVRGRLLADRGDFRRIDGDDAFRRDFEDQAGTDVHMLVDQTQVAFIHALGGGDAGIIVSGSNNIGFFAGRQAWQIRAWRRRGRGGGDYRRAGFRGPGIRRRAPVKEALVDENQADGDDVDEEDDDQRAGDLRAAVVRFHIRSGCRGGDALFAVAGDGAQAAEDSFGRPDGV